MSVDTCQTHCESKNTSSAHQGLLRQGLQVESFLLAYNILEAIAAIWFGLVATSIALVGFGLDSIIEIAVAIIIIRRLLLEQKGLPFEDTERYALRFIGITFFLLATYVSYESVHKLIYQIPAEESLPGIILATLSLIVMPLLGYIKLRIARKLKSRALRAGAMETLVCASLSFALLLGLVMNLWIGWWWVDAITALCMVPIMLKEGWGSMRGEACC